MFYYDMEGNARADLSGDDTEGYEDPTDESVAEGSEDEDEDKDEDEEEEENEEKNGMNDVTTTHTGDTSDAEDQSFRL